MSAPASRPPHRAPRLLLLVLLGGTVGTLLRYGTGLLLPHRPGTWPWSVLLVNLAGAFALGVLLESLSRRGPDTGVRRDLRLGLGTGVLGGFTTYSALTVDAVELVRAGRPVLALLYGAGSVVFGVLAVWAGVTLAARGVPPATEPVDPDAA